MTNQTIHPKLSHLSPEEIETLMRRYYMKKDRVDDLIREYKIDCSTSGLSSLFPPKILKDQHCRYCNVPMVQTRLSRSSGSSPYAYCPQCGHKIGRGRCICWKCSVTEGSRNRYERQDPKFDTIGAYARFTWPKSIFTGSVTNLDLRSAVSLLGLVRACLFLELKGEMVPEGYPVTLNPIVSAALPFAPTFDLCSEYLNGLMTRGLVAISELSENDAFEFKHGSIDGYYLEYVRWVLTIEEPRALIKSIEQLARTPGAWPASWHTAVKDVWLEIALSECKQFYTYCSEQRGLPIAEETSVAAMLQNLIQDYSVAQCYRIIYAGAQRAADFLVRKQCHLKHAANYMVGECQRWADRARAEKWEVKSFRRNYDLPRTSLSYVLFDVFLSICDEGFYSVPGRAVPLRY